MGAGEAARAAAVAAARADVKPASEGSATARTSSATDEHAVNDRKRILGSSIDAVIVNRAHCRVPIEDRVTILWRGEGPDDLPRRGRDNGPIRPYRPQG